MAVLTVTLLLFTPCNAQSTDAIYSWHNNDKTIALTFDDGPHPRYTPEILEILAEYDIKATFFCIGQNVEWYPHLVETVAKEGHEIGNHTFTHNCMRSRSLSDLSLELSTCSDAIYNECNLRPTLLRPPGGLYDEAVVDIAKEQGYKIICWSIDTEDWAHRSVDSITESILNTVEGGDIILFHDYIASPSPTPEVLRRIIPILLERGYRFLTVSELIAS